MTILVALLAIALVLPIADLIGKPIIRRQALRNMVRRPGETAIVLVGALLGTAIITASFIVGDTVGGSVRDIARTNLGPIDEGIVVEDIDRLDEIATAVETAQLDGVDGTVRAARTRVAVATAADTGSSRRAEPSAAAFGLDFDDVRAFGDDPATTGFELAGSTPETGEVAISQHLADALEVGPGDEVEVFVFGHDLRLEVIATLPNVGLAGRGGEAIFVGPGTIQTWWQDSTLSEVQGPFGEVLVSNVGGVFDGADATPLVLPQLESLVGHLPGVDVGAWKADLLADADLEGQELTTIFSSIGAFAVIAGILLVVNIVVMLTDERRVQLGVLRALGLRRSHVVRVMGLEGTGYAVLASAAGVVVGLGVGWIVARFASAVVANDGLDLNFAVERSSLVIGGALGLLVTLVTVWGTSIRLAAMNVIAAIRELPSPERRRARVVRFAAGGTGVLAGVGLTMLGIGGSPVPAMIGPPVAAFGAIPLLRPLLGGRLTPTLAGGLSIAWGISVFGVLPDAMHNPEIAVFVFQGVVLVAGAVTVLTVNSSMWQVLVRGIGNGPRAVPVRLGLTYPLARPGRTGLILGMYSLVIFTIMFMAIMMSVFRSQSDEIAAEASAGFDIVVDTNRANPATDAAFEALPEIGDATGLVRVPVDFGWNGDTFDVPLTGIAPGFLRHGGAPLSSWSGEFASQAEVYDALLTRTDVAVVGEFLIGDDGGEDNPVVGDTVTLTDVDEGEPLTVEIVGIMANDWLWNGVLVGRGTTGAVVGEDAIESRHYLTTADGVSASTAAAAVNGTLIANGADARAFEEDILADINSQNGFIRILQGYLGLGLLIGVAGLAIVLVRAVRERRREIGMLRAMGYHSTTVRRSFLVEALFIAGQGSVLGVVLGTATAWQVVTQADVFAVGAPELDMPWVSTVVILIAPVAASLLAAVWPAHRASHIRPAVALRVTG